eukprot:485692-Pyramimonas_sp.AAC.1
MGADGERSGSMHMVRHPIKEKKDRKKPDGERRSRRAASVHSDLSSVASSDGRAHHGPRGQRLPLRQGRAPDDAPP